MFLAGLDIGTTGCKVTVYRDSGEYMGRVYRDYPSSRGTGGHEIDAQAVWTAVQGVLQDAAERWPGIAGLGIASFGETFVALDAENRPVFPAMLNTDPRGKEECALLTERLGRERIAQITGLNPHEMYSLPKLMWLKRREPERFARVRRVCLMADYIGYRLTGCAVIDYSLATRTMGFDIRALCWSDEIFRAAELDPALFSRPVPTGAAAGTVRPGAQVHGLEGAAVVPGGHDQVAAAIGSGVFCEDVTVDGAGTVECLTPVFAAFDAARMAEGNYAVVPYIIPGKYVTYAFNYTGGALTKWFAETLGGSAAQRAQAEGSSVYAALEQP